MKVFNLLAILMIAVSVFSCKKDKADNSIDGRFQGTWIEQDAHNISLVVSKAPESGLPSMMLILGFEKGATGYKFAYQFNDAGDRIYLTSAEGTDVPYEITFSNENKTFTIKKFHSKLPDVDLLTFNKR